MCVCVCVSVGGLGEDNGECRSHEGIEETQLLVTVATPTPVSVSFFVVLSIWTGCGNQDG